MRVITRWLTGIPLYSGFSWIIDYPIYSYVIWKLGIITGGILMSAIAFVIDLVTLVLYDKAATDWLALETAKELRNYSGSNRIKRLMAHVLTKTPFFIQLLFCSIKFNPFMTTTFLRPSAHEYPGMTKRDWSIFLASFVICQTYWTLIISGAVFAAAFILNFR